MLKKLLFKVVLSILHDAINTGHYRGDIYADYDKTKNEPLVYTDNNMIVFPDFPQYTHLRKTVKEIESKIDLLYKEYSLEYNPNPTLLKKEEEEK